MNAPALELPRDSPPKFRSGLRLVVHGEVPIDEQFRHDWNALVFAMDSPEVFFTWEWARAVSIAYRDLKPLILAAYRDDQLAGIVALAQDDAGAISFLCGTTADYCDFVSSADDRLEFVALVLDKLRELNVAEFRFGNVPDESATVPALHAMSSRFVLFARTAYVCSQIPLDSTDKRQAALRSSQRRLKKLESAAANADHFHVSHTQSWDECTAEMPDFEVAHVGRFLATGRVSNLVRSERRMFLRELARLLCEQKWFLLTRLQQNARTIAWNYGFRFAGKWFYYQPTFDVEAQRCSPGSYLLSSLIADAARDESVINVDLGLGDEEYKSRYGQAVRRTLHITGCRSKSRARWAACRYQVAEAVKRSPWVESHLRQGIQKLNSFRLDVEQHGLAHSLRRAVRNSEATGAVFMEWMKEGRLEPPSDLTVAPASMKMLASAAIRDGADDRGLKYFLRAAKALQSGSSEIVALCKADGTPVYFCFAESFQKFQMPGLKEPLRNPTANTVVLHDFWTPSSHSNHVARFTAVVAAHLHSEGKRPWASVGRPDVVAFEEAGFVSRFQLSRKAKLFSKHQSTVEFPVQDFTVGIHPAA